MPMQRSLKTIVPILVIAVASAGLVGALHYQHARLRAQSSAYWTRRMEASADATHSSVEAWLDERHL